MAKHRTRLLAGLMALGLALTGCSGGGGAGRPVAEGVPDKPAEAQSTPSKGDTEELPVIRVVTNTPKGNIGFFQMAKHKGFFEEEGVRVEYTFVENIPSAVRAFLSGEADIYENSIGSILDAAALGNVGGKIVGGSLVGLSYNIYAKNDIQSAKDLEGRSTGLAAVGGFLDELMTLYMIDNGADPDKLIRANSGGSAASFQALVVGKVDSVAAGPEFIKVAEEDPNIHILARLGEEMKDYVMFAIVASNDLLTQRRDDLKAYLKAYARGLRHAIENKEETAQLAASMLNMSADDEGLSIAYDLYVDQRLIAPSLEISARQIDYMINARKLMGGLKGPLTATDILDTSLQEQVMGELPQFDY